MPLMFTCRLLKVRAGGGKFRVRYGRLSERRVEVLAFEGPEVLAAPEGEMTEKEIEEWRAGLSVRCFCPVLDRAVGPDAPAVEGRWAPEGESFGDIFKGLYEEEGAGD
jgi:hypothetical protein